MIPTIRVKPWSSDHGLFVILNEEDFDPARHELYVEAEEAARHEREAEENARLKAERKTAEVEALRRAETDAATAARQAFADGAPPLREGQGGSAPEQSGEPGSRLGEPGAVDQETPPCNDDDAAPAGQGAGPAESAAGAPVSAEGGNGASTAEAHSLTVGKGPKGLWFVKSAGVIASPGFPTEEGAAAALAEIAARDQK